VSSKAPELVWRYAGQTHKRNGQLLYQCEACSSAGLSVWRRVLPGIDVLRCWNHGPGLTGAECDGPKR